MTYSQAALVMCLVLLPCWVAYLAYDAHRKPLRGSHPGQFKDWASRNHVPFNNHGRRAFK